MTIQIGECERCGKKIIKPGQERWLQLNCRTGEYSDPEVRGRLDKLIIEDLARLQGHLNWLQTLASSHPALSVRDHAQALWDLLK